MVKISHECPLQLLETSRLFNDYDYCLVHLLDKYPQYYEFMKESLKRNRCVILDNSIFELGTSFKPKEFAQWIKKLQPTEYIVPDVLENSEETINQFKNWLSKYKHLKGTRIGVVQGKTFNDLYTCYKFMSENADKIAISFDYSFYKQIGLGKSPEEQDVDGRYKFIRMLIDCGIWNTSKSHHLLGCMLPQEMKKYAYNWHIYNITSLDTSNPVQQGLLGFKYTKEGLKTKSRIKVADSFEHKYSEEKINIAKDNIELFRKFCSKG